jgi:thymidylate kinase
MLNNPENRSTRFVSFSGMDGAGKSTQIAALRSRVEGSGVPVRIITFWDDVARLTRFRESAGHKIFKGDKGIGSPDRPINRRDKNVRSWKMTLVRLFLYSVDAVSLRRVVKRALRSGRGFVICDRYAWDELANLNLANPLIRMYVRLIAAFVPRPDVSYVLDADPIAARARKPEYPVEFLHICRASYYALSRILSGLTVIPPGTVEEVERAIASAVTLGPAQPYAASRCELPLPVDRSAAS